MSSISTNLLDFQFFQLDLSTRIFTVNGSLIFLKNKEFQLLEFFLKNPDRIITRTEILEEVWDRNIFCHTNTVDVHVSRLRKKINKYFPNQKIIKTVYCVGYLCDVSFFKNN